MRIQQRVEGQAGGGDVLTGALAAVDDGDDPLDGGDGGFEKAREFVLRHIVPDIERAVASEHQQNYKSQLQQHAQKELGVTPAYELLDEKGPDHSKCFEVAVCISGQRFPSAWGPSKKEAEQKAAYNALVAMELAPEEESTSDRPHPESE